MAWQPWLGGMGEVSGLPRSVPQVAEALVAHLCDGKSLPQTMFTDEQARALTSTRESSGYGSCSWSERRQGMAAVREPRRAVTSSITSLSLVFHTKSYKGQHSNFTGKNL